MPESWLEILPQREKVAADYPQICQRFKQFLLRLTYTEHQPGLGINTLAASRFHLFEHTERTVVSRAMTHRRRQTPHRLEVVVEYVRTCAEHRVNGLVA